MTLDLFLNPDFSIPKLTSILLADITEFRGKQELFKKQNPQRLRMMLEHALIESTISSNRMEGVTIEESRLGTVVFGHPLLRNRDEEEIQGYRNTLEWIHRNYQKLLFSEKTIKDIHKKSRNDSWDAGEYRVKDSDIIEKLPNGKTVIRFKPTPGRKIVLAMKELQKKGTDCLIEHPVHPLLALIGINLDFLCIHPFRDGNGRVSRLLLLLQLYHENIEVGKYISLERLIEENKEGYYETLKLSSKGWHEGKNDPWPYINFILLTLKKAYKNMEIRSEEYTSHAKGEKTLIIEEAINSAPNEFTLAYIEAKCPGVSMELIRKILKKLKTEGKVESLRKGPNAPWKKR